MGFDTYVSDTNLETKECKNLKSAQDDPQAVRKLIKKECDNGYAYPLWANSQITSCYLFFSAQIAVFQWIT